MQIIAVFTALFFVGLQTEIRLPPEQLAQVSAGDSILVLQQDTAFYAVIESINDSTVFIEGLEK